MKNLRQLMPPARLRRLDNGLTVCAVEDRRAPLAAVAVVYRAGARDETPQEAGAAHFLEHMMFKGSRRFGPGEVDRLTRLLGGSNNAYTSHDCTLYYFTFAADRWRRALEIEADRMAALTLDPAEVRSERQVILEELAMYESEPWDALEMRVAADYFGGHPYGRPVLGTRASLSAIDGAVLADFHRRFYRPANAVVAVAGDVGQEVSAEVEEAFGHLDGPPPSRIAICPPRRPRKLERIERRHGEMARLLLTLPAPGAADPDHPLLLLLLAVLGSGRASRLHRGLVEEGQLAVWVTTELVETVEPGAASIALEVVPGVDPARVEAELLAALGRLKTSRPTGGEIERAKKILLADWIFGHEKGHQMAFLLGSALALFDADHPWRYLDRLLAAAARDLPPIVERYLDPSAGGVLGWSLPKEPG